MLLVREKPKSLLKGSNARFDFLQDWSDGVDGLVVRLIILTRISAG